MVGPHGGILPQKKNTKGSIPGRIIGRVCIDTMGKPALRMLQKLLSGNNILSDNSNIQTFAPPYRFYYRYGEYVCRYTTT